jgi:hypothetical protein
VSSDTAAPHSRDGVSRPRAHPRRTWQLRHHEAVIRSEMRRLARAFEPSRMVTRAIKTTPNSARGGPEKPHGDEGGERSR